MPLLPPASPDRAPSLSNPETFEEDNSAMLSWFIQLVDWIIDEGVYTEGDFTLSDVAFKSYVDAQLAALVDTSPAALDTLNELAAALGDDPNFATTVNASIAAKLPKAGGTMSGNIDMGGHDITNIGNIAGTPTVDGYEVWHAGNDGAGSGLDADTVDGIQGSKILRNDQNGQITGALTVSGAVYAEGEKLAAAKKAFGYFSNNYGLGTLLFGSTTGDLYEGVGSGHVVVGIRGNDINDGFWVVDTSGAGATGTYDRRILQVSPLGFDYMDQAVWHEGNFSPSDYLPLTGGNVSGTIKINGGSTGQLTLNRSADTTYGGLTFQTAGVDTWLLYQPNNASGDLKLQSRNYGTDGSVRHQFLTYEWATGRVVFDQTPFVNGSKVWHEGNDGAGSGLDADTLDGLNSGQFLHSQENDTMNGNLTVNGVVSATGRLQADTIDVNTGGTLLITAGESRGNAGALDTEKIYLAAENGLKVVSSSDNWASGWGGRHEAQLVDSSGDSFFPRYLYASGRLVATDASAAGGVVGSLCFAANSGASSVAFGGTVSGSLLRPTNVGGSTGSTLTGTWRCCGIASNGGTSGGGNISLFMRIA